jgi:signal transduction histidine kinase
LEARGDSRHASSPLGHRPPFGRGLSARILLLSIAVLLLGEALIYFPSIARFRLVWLEERLARAHLATLPLERAGTAPVALELEDALLKSVEAQHLRVIRAGGTVELGRPVPVDRAFDLAHRDPLGLIVDALATFAARGQRLIRVRGPAASEPGAEVEVTLAEAPLVVAMVEYSWRILALSAVLSVILAAFLFLALRRLIVWPLQRITRHLARFRERPEDALQDLVPSRRSDEINIVEWEVAGMQRAIRAALLERTRLAALGAAVARVNHDLNNMLASAMLISDRLETAEDPRVQDLARRLLATLERASRFCTETLAFAQSRPGTLRTEPVQLRAIIREAGMVLGDGIECRVEVPPDLVVLGDPDQLYRVFLNLFRNAEQAMGGRGTLALRGESHDSQIVVDVSDSGPGIPEKVRERLFQPFAAAVGRGSGLGLAICREILRAHGGDIELLATGPQGTTFRITLPAAAERQNVLRRYAA